MIRFASAGVFAASLAVLVVSAADAPMGGAISTFAGTGVAGSTGDDGAATSARLNGPGGLAVDSSGNLYIADSGNNRIRKVTAATGVITSVVTSGLSGPTGVAVDAAGNLYIANRGVNRISKWTASTGVLSTLAGTGTAGYSGDGGLATAATLSSPYGVALDSVGHVFIADYSNNVVRRVDATTGIITTVAGTGTYSYTGDGGPATAATLREPIGVAVDTSGHLYIADYSNAVVRRVHGTTGVITTIAGTGQIGYSGEAGAGTAARLDSPIALALDGASHLLIADLSVHRVRRLSLTTGIITTVAGSGAAGSDGDGGLATAASLNLPNGVAVDASGRIYIADAGNQKVRRVAAATTPVRVMSTLAGTGVEGFTADGASAATAQLAFPTGVAVDASGHVYIADSVNGRVRKVDATSGLLTTVAGTGEKGSTGDGGLATVARVEALAVALDTSGNLFLVDQTNRRIRRVAAATGIITTYAGTGVEVSASTGDGGPATSATFVFPSDAAMDAAGNLYVADRSDGRIRKITPGGTISTVAGSGGFGFSGDGGAATVAQLNDPTGVAVDTAGNVYIADRGNHRIRKVTAATGVITTVAGTGVAGYNGEAVAATTAMLREPFDVVVDAAGRIYVTDLPNRRVRMVDTAGVITTVAGASTTAVIGSALSYGGDGGAATAALMRQPRSVAVDADGHLYIADDVDHRVRKATMPVEVPVSPAITQHPVSATITAGQNVTFTVEASGVPTPTLQWQISTDGGSTFTSLTNTSPYSGVTASTLTVTAASVTLHGARYRAVATSTGGTAVSTSTGGTAVSTSAILSVRGAMTVSPASLTFRATKAGPTGVLIWVTSPQTLTVTFAGAPSSWIAGVTVPWLHAPTGSGSAAGQFAVNISNSPDVIGGSTRLVGAVRVTSPTSPTVTVDVPVVLDVTQDGSATSAPIGQVDTPAQNALGVQGAIGVTGWALDDIGVSRVVIYRNCLVFDNPSSCQTVLGMSVVLVGEAAFLAGARPDVEAAFSTYPRANRAGWGYLMLTPMLPHVTGARAYGGEGPLTLYAVATDVEGNQKLLGRSSDPASPDFAVPTQFTMANDSIAKPFGAIDTPAQGETVSGILNNFGWALTPDTNTTAGAGDIVIPTDGSTMTVFIDGLPTALVTYNQCRGSVGNPVPAGQYCNDDVSNIFGNTTPQPVLTSRLGNATLFRNLDVARAPIGSYSFNTATLSNGLHTIAWSVTDSAGRTEGIGSRFFNVLNSGADQKNGGNGGNGGIGGNGGSGGNATDAALRARPAAARGLAATLDVVPTGDGGVWFRTGFDLTQPWVDLPMDTAGVRRVTVPEGGRAELWLGARVDAAYLVANGELRDLPVGARLFGPASAKASAGKLKDPRTSGPQDLYGLAWTPPAGYIGEYHLAFLRGPERIDVTVTVR